jgi:disulfide bond formation protein DsbB/thiol-disulfide isomerase/thioredoxin
MIVSNEAVLIATRFFALLAIACAVLGLLALAGRVPSLRQRRHTGERWLAPAAVPLAAAVAIVSTAGSLFYSEMAGFAPCTLCWVQRGFMYPLAILLVIVAATGRYALLRVSRWLAFGGLAVAAFHVLVERIPRLEPGGMCAVNNPCSFQWVSDLGFVTLPGMALAGFAAIAALVTVAIDLPKRRPTAAALRARMPALGAAVMVFALVAFVTGRPAVEPPDAGLVQESPVTVSGAPLLPFDPTFGVDPAVGQPAPAFSGTDFAGVTAELVPEGDGPALVVFLAHWCGACQAELPELVDWMEAGRADGVRVVAVSTGASSQQPNWPPSAWFTREGWPGLVVADDGTAAQAYGLSAFPFMAVIGADGTVVERHAGRWAVAELETALGRAAALR